FTTFLLPFEITSLLLLVAAVGAVYLTRRSRSGTQPIMREAAVTRKPTVLDEDRIEVEVG
ncbi:MAG TPA: NADH-quinone oxidoreductase subunit J, partial [Candidatus Dormibacteraeota bacterium]|nr:NADH-quinone oxidoreductase subunit J [Candidatus Dormibacteraeota bacterium]